MVIWSIWRFQDVLLRYKWGFRFMRKEILFSKGWKRFKFLLACKTFSALSTLKIVYFLTTKKLFLFNQVSQPKFSTTSNVQKWGKIFLFLFLFCLFVFAKTNGIYIRYIFFVEYVYACTIINQDFYPLIFFNMYIFFFETINMWS